MNEPLVDDDQTSFVFSVGRFADGLERVVRLIDQRRKCIRI